MVVKDLLATSVLIAARCKRLLWRVERAQMSLLKTKYFLKYCGNRPCTHFLTRFRMCSSRLDLVLGHFKAFIAVSLLDVLITILSTRFYRVSRVPLFTSPQHPRPQHRTEEEEVGLIIDQKMALALCVVI